MKIVIPAEKLANAINKYLLQPIVDDPARLKRLVENYRKNKASKDEVKEE